MRIDISVPDVLAEEARRFDIPVSEVVQAALRQAVAESRAAQFSMLRVSVAEEAERAARVRLIIAEDYPDDARNVQCAKTLEALAEYVLGLPADDPRLAALLDFEPDGDYWPAPWHGERWNHVIYRLGFHGGGVLAPHDALDELLSAVGENGSEFAREPEQG